MPCVEEKGIEDLGSWLFHILPIKMLQWNELYFTVKQIFYNIFFSYFVLWFLLIIIYFLQELHYHLRIAAIDPIWV